MRLRDSLRVGVSAINAVAWFLLAISAAPAQPPIASGPLCLEQLACMNWCELEHLYRQANPGTIPAGYTRGRAIYCPGALLTPARDRMTRTLWHGKHFCPDDGTLTNQWCLGQAVRARVCYGDSWLDGKPSIIMDYRGMSHVWKDVRDEIREVSPGLYLGIMYRGKGAMQQKMFFTLDARK
jgi:hypothetical protein